MISSLLYFIIALGVLVFVHELGHFLVAKRAGIKVERFSLGYPPKMIGFQWGDTEYCISWIPFGGYVKVAGMADVGTEEGSGEPWEFPSKPIWVRMAVIAAGPVMNFAFAFVAFVFLYAAYGVDTVDSTAVDPMADSPAAIAGLRYGDSIVRVGEQPVQNYRELSNAFAAADGRALTVDVERDRRIISFDLPAVAEADDAFDSDLLYGMSLLYPTRVGRVIPDMPAAEIGLAEGDRITSVAGVEVRDWDEMRTQISRHPDEAIELRWVRDGSDRVAQITPQANSSGDRVFGQIGIGPQTKVVGIGLGEALTLSASSVYNSSWLILDFISSIFKEDRYKELGGPIRIAKMAGETAERGLKPFVYFLALLSVNLAILNLLPIPVLDGGHLTFLSLEAIMRRPLSLKQREFFQQVGLVFILGLMVLVTFNDLNQLVFHRIVELFQ